MLTEDDKADRMSLRLLFEKRQIRDETKEGFFYFENQSLMIAESQETYVVMAGDMAIGFPLFMYGESDFSKFIKATTLLSKVKNKKLDVLWDVGANIGSICIPAVKRQFVKKAIAFEPERTLFKLLRTNAILNDVDNRIACYHTALGDFKGSVDLTMGEGNTGDYRIAGRLLEDDSMGESFRRIETVDIRPMNDFVDLFEANSTLIFMDIQGYEGLALKGADKIISTAPPLVVEFWPYAMKRLDTYELLRDIVSSGLYREYADLSEDNGQFRAVSAGALDALYETIGESQNASTDLVFV
ncbi:FkbM family methyltransferase [Rhizobium sp. RHZ02]|uniref:FkbM family methyltransferase n=1 Tax=Rhizobium sp. RHZ02 TaxID=2769306 RepID=UPI00177DDD01|nr:FkbM family methyltransferase [Rhizobium sp. RHZ02]MBD9453533.1 FkbM family methyltransferase [Rhizobium sp. RHZ02]